jgi:hypothetical protein
VPPPNRTLIAPIRRCTLDLEEQFAQLVPANGIDIAPNGHSRRVETGVPGEHLGFQRLQLGGGIKARLVGKEAPGSLIGSQCLDLATSAIQGEHVLGPEALLEGILLGQPFEFPDQTCVDTGAEVGVDAIAKRHHPQTLETSDLGCERHLIL